MGAVILLQDHYCVPHVTVNEVDLEVGPYQGPLRISFYIEPTSLSTMWKENRLFWSSDGGGGGGGVPGTPFQRRVIPGNGLQSILPRGPPCTQGSGPFSAVRPGVSFPPPSSNIRTHTLNVPQGRGMNGRSYLLSYHNLSSDQPSQRYLSRCQIIVEVLPLAWMQVGHSQYRSMLPDVTRTVQLSLTRTPRLPTLRSSSWALHLPPR